MIQIKEKLGEKYKYSEDLFTTVTFDDFETEALKDTDYALEIMEAYKEMEEEELQKLNSMTRMEYRIKYSSPRNYTESEKQLLNEAFRLLLAAASTLLVEGIPNPAAEINQKVIEKELELSF